MKNFSFFRMLLDFIYPRRCPVCDKAVKPFGSLICEECVPKIEYVKAPYCQKCGKAIQFGNFCPECKKAQYGVKGGFELFRESDADEQRDLDGIS